LQEHPDISRQAELREAAGVLVRWLHTRRATWPREPVEAAPAQPVLTAPPIAIFDAEPAVAEPAVVEPASTVVRLRTATVAVGSLAASLVRGAAQMKPVAASLVRGAVRLAPGARAAGVVAVVAVVAVAGCLATPYVGNVKTWLTEQTGKATSPKREPVAARPAPPASARRTGQLMAQSEPAGAKVLVDGRERGVTPLTLDDVAIGPHTVVLQSDKGSVRRTVTVAANRSAVVSESIFAGWLAVFAPFELQITEGASAIRLDESGKVLLPPGPHGLHFENRDLGYSETRRVEVQPGQTTSLSLVAPPSTLTVTANAPGVVSIDGQQVGETPLTNQPIALGTREILVKGADGTERRFTRKVTVAPVQIVVDFSKP
jgi:hypothetical protein